MTNLEGIVWLAGTGVLVATVMTVVVLVVGALIAVGRRPSSGDCPARAARDGSDHRLLRRAFVVPLIDCREGACRHRADHVAPS